MQNISKENQANVNMKNSKEDTTKVKIVQEHFFFFLMRSKL